MSLLQMHAVQTTQTGTRQEQPQSPIVLPTSSRELPWKVKITGRYKFGEDSRSIMFDQDGLTLFARFTGVETLSVSMSMTCSIPHWWVGFVAWCDGELVAGPGLNAFTVDGSKRTIPVCSGLDQHTEHTVRILKNTDAACPVEFTGFGDAMLLDSPPPRTRRIEYIGDSMTSGSYLMCNNQSYALGFAQRSCGMLRADCHTTAQSGWGLTINTEGSSRTVMDLWEGTLYSRRDADTWDFSSWIPDAVVVNLGTNDDLADELADAYTAKYLKWLARANEVYQSKATFFLACGPMTTKYCAAVKKVIDTASRWGVRALFLDLTDEGLPTERQRDLHMCMQHPNAAGHEYLAGQVAKTLRSELGWH